MLGIKLKYIYFTIFMLGGGGVIFYKPYIIYIERVGDTLNKQGGREGHVWPGPEKN